jgi:hypothetical protein
MSEREHYYCQRKISGKSRLPVNQSLLGLLIYNSSKIYKINKKYFDERKKNRAGICSMDIINQCFQGRNTIPAAFRQSIRSLVVVTSTLTSLTRTPLNSDSSRKMPLS